MNKQKSVFWLHFIVVVFLAIGVSRLTFVNLVMGEYYSKQARGNTIRSEKIKQVRGVIYDRNGKQLAVNIEHDGKDIRFYPFGEVTASVLGYVGKIDEQTLKKCSPVCDGETEIGRMGLEKQYDEKLGGISGEMLVEERASGETRSWAVKSEGKVSENIKSNLDVDLQKIAFIALKEKLKETGRSGAIIVSRVNGEVLAMVSAPSFDNNLFIDGGKRSDFGGDYKNVTDIIADTEKKPLFNRAISGDFAPGSVYKIIPSIAALEEGKITEKTTILDTGEIKIGEYRFGNWYLDKYGRTEGEVDVIKGLSRSNDIFYYRIGEMLGVDSLVKWSKVFGLGEKTGVDLPSEVRGLLPDPYWREKILGERWFLGNTFHLSIGQGDLMATPLQINTMTASVVSAKKCIPKIVGKSDCLAVNIKDENRKIIIKGMEKACSPDGTAFPLFKYAGKVYCKTGTAQKGGEETLPNSWISVVVPEGSSVDDWIVMTILVEEGGEGSAVAGAVAAEIVGELLR